MQVKKRLLTILTSMLSIFIVSACSAVEEVNNSIAYMNKATDYINKLSALANEAPTLIEQAATDPTSLEELNTKLDELQNEIQAFNQLNPPEIAQDIHSQILEHNTQLEAALEVYTNQLENGQIDPSLLQNSELMQQINQLSNMLEQIQSLGG